MMQDRRLITAMFRPYLPSALLFVLCMAVPGSALTPNDPRSAFLFHFTHASVWHFLANFYVIVRFRPRWVNLPVAYLSATAAALVPIAGMSAPTVGMSGVIFAMLARRDAILRVWNWRLLGLNALLALVPCYNWKIHLFSYLIAFTIWKTYLTLKDLSR